MSEIVKELQEHLPLELAAHIRYAGHSQLIRYRGFFKLADKYASEAEEELEHAKAVEFRLLELGAVPEYTSVEKTAPLKEWNIEDLLRSDLAFEESVLESLTERLDCAEHESDYVSSQMLRKLSVDTQEHITWLYSQVCQLEELGAQNYLQAQL